MTHKYTLLPLACSSPLQNSCALEHNSFHETEDDKEAEAGKKRLERPTYMSVRFVIK